LVAVAGERQPDGRASALFEETRIRADELRKGVDGKRRLGVARNPAEKQDVEFVADRPPFEPFRQVRPTVNDVIAFRAVVLFDVVADAHRIIALGMNVLTGGHRLRVRRADALPAVKDDRPGDGREVTER